MSQMSSEPVRTFSIGFDEKNYSELHYARMVADRYSTQHHEFNVKSDMLSVVPKLIWHYDQPFADSSALPSYFVSQQTRQHVTVALNGDGGDESFAGYRRYQFDALINFLEKLPAQKMRKWVSHIGSWIPESALGHRLLRQNRMATPRNLRKVDRNAI